MAFSPSPIPPSGGTGRITVATTPECAWTASENLDWISQLSPTSGQGSGEIAFHVATNTGGTPRQGDLTVGVATIHIEQIGSCTVQLGSTSTTVADVGGPLSVPVTAPSGCPWTAVSGSSWITVTSGASGIGNGTVAFTVAANTGAARNGTLTIAGQTVTVSQNTFGGACTFAISPTSQSIAAAGGAGTSSVTAGAGCAWTAISHVPWITIASGASGTGNAAVNFSIAVNTAPARQGTLTIAGRTFTVTQSSGCAYSISPTSQSIGSGGTTGSSSVTTSGGCGWTATSNASWMTITAGASGNGSGVVSFSTAANTGPARQGTLTIAGQTFTINQASGCTFTINPTSRTHGPLGGSGSVAVTTAAGCSWTAVSNSSWITIVTGASGTGNGSVSYTVAIKPPTPVGNRAGTMTIAGRTFTVTQTP